MVTTEHSPDALAILKSGLKKIRAGWAKGAFHTNAWGKDDVCAVGGLRIAAFEHFGVQGHPDLQVTDPLIKPAYLEAVRLVAAEIESNGYDRSRDPERVVMHFNDQSTTRFQDITRRFEKAVLNLERVLEPPKAMAAPTWEEVRPVFVALSEPPPSPSVLRRFSDWLRGQKEPQGTTYVKPESVTVQKSPHDYTLK